MFPVWLIPVIVFLVLLLPSFALYRRGVYQGASVRWAIRLVAALALLAAGWLYLRGPGR